MHWRKVPSRSNGKVFYAVVRLIRLAGRLAV
jgi:hypothetical protein